MTTYQRTAIYSSDDIRAVADGAGSHFFDPDTMRFFNSRLLSGAWVLDGNECKPGHRYLFVTSERYGDEPRHYTVRIMTLGTVRDNRPAVDIDTLSCPYPSAREARAAMNAHARNVAYLN